MLISCGQDKEIKINEKLLLENLQQLSSDEFEGRGFSKEGNYKAQQLMANQFKALGLASVLDSGYIQQFPYTFKGKRRQRMFPIDSLGKDAENVPDTTVVGGNVLAMVKGKTDKVIVVTGHLDHLGIRNGEIYNGADDDASGTAALVAIAAYFKTKAPKHTLVFAAVDAEEIGSLGADYLVNNFPLDIQKVVLNVNMDMIAHNDSLQLYASGLYHYPQLKKPMENINSPISLLFGHDDPDNKDLDDWTFSSDHRIFHKLKIPFIYFGVEDHKDYHKATDTFENINQEFYIEAVKLIIQVIENYDNTVKD
tara:strand:- start:18053 stop:18979 length:927 start_codon:yes stop_codon:yes gene_type:complete